MIGAQESYTLKSALFWGNCQKHYQNFFDETAWNGRAVIHLALSIFEAIPLIGQIISLAEIILVRFSTYPTTPITRTGIAIYQNQRIDEEGKTSAGNHSLEDRWFKKALNGNCSLWGVFDGHGGDEIAKKAAQVFHKYFQNMHLLKTDSEIKEKIKNAYQTFNKDYFKDKEEFISSLGKAREIMNQIKMDNPNKKNWILTQENQTFNKASGEAAQANEKLGAGSTACTLLLIENKLFAANVGDSRIILVSKSQESLNVEQLTVDHNTDCDEELNRLQKLGLNKEEIKKNKRIGNSQVTRSLGDFSVGPDWKNFDILKEASSAPVICDPHISDPIQITQDHQFVFLMSDGIYDAVCAFSRCNEQEANILIAEEIHKRFHENGSLSEVAKEVIEWVISEQIKARKDGNENCNRLDDLTLMIVPLKNLPLM